MYWEYYAEELTKIFQDNLPESQAKDADKLARASARSEADADEKVDKILADIGSSMDLVLNRARERKAEEIVQQYVRREPEAVALVEELLASANLSVGSFMTDALAEKLDDIERIDRLTTIAENRRNNSLREIDRRRALVGQSRRNQEIESNEYKVIELPQAKGKAQA